MSLSTDHWVLLGASNLTRALPQVLSLTREPIDPAGRSAPARYLIAAGHGRSFGLYSRVLGRGLGGILQSGLWSAIDRGAGTCSPLRALITDIGNDIAYGQSVDDIAAWIEQCIVRLQSYEARIVLTELPLASLQTLSPWRFQQIRAIFFPSNQRSLAETLDAVQALNNALRQLADRYRLPLVVQPPEWFGWDPVHIRRAELRSAYRAILAPFLDPVAQTDHSYAVPLATRLRLQLTPPETQDFLRWRQQCRQPALMLKDGTTLAFY
jgi:hypothetical protein